MARGRKLYFDVVLTGPSAFRAIPLTRFSAGWAGDRNGAFLDTVAALDGNATTEQKQRAEISLFPVPVRYSPAANPGISAGLLALRTGFLRAYTSAVAAIDGPAVDALLAPYYTAGGAGTTSVPAKAGRSAVFQAGPVAYIYNQSVVAGGGRSFFYTLHVQRQHTIEV